MKLNTLKPRVWLALLAGTAVLSGNVIATPVNIPDHSFENSNIADGGVTGSPNGGPSWTATGNGGVFLLNPLDDRFPNSTETTVPPGNLPAPADGTNCVNMSIGATLGYVWQNIGTLQANTIYTLTVAAGQDLINGGGVGVIALVNGVNPFGTTLASAPVDTTAVTAGTFADFTLVFTTGQNVSGSLTILLRGDSGAQIIWDNARLDATAAPQAPTALAIAVSPTNVVYQGALVTLTEDPAGATPLAYQWQSDNGSGGITFTAVSGATSASHVVDTSGFTPGSPVVFRVVVTNTFGASTSAPVAITAITGAPVIKTDTLPVTGSDVEGSTVKFTASFDGSQPISYYQWQRDGLDIPNATNTTLTITNLQFSDTGSYQLLAGNSFGTNASTARSFQVNPAPTPDGNLLTSVATQTGNGGATFFTPTWQVSTNNLIAGAAPSEVGVGNFTRDGSGVVAVLTDGNAGQLNPAGNGSTELVTGGINNGAADFGTSVTYTLPASPTGYDVTNIVVYGGWSDDGHDQQRYIVYYSTVASPATFNQLTLVDFNPTPAGPVQSATRITLTGTNGSALAKNVAAIRLDFNVLVPPVVEGGYAGYSEIGIAGFASAAAPVIATNTTPTLAIDVEGSSVTFYAAFGSATPLTYQWRKDTGGGPVPISGATSPTLTLNNLQLSDAGSYSLLASNASGTAVSTASPLTVNAAPGPDGGGVIVSPATQEGNSPFATTWTVPTGSLIAGQIPNSIGGGNFLNENCGGLPRLTDGTYGVIGGAQNGTLASCGPNAGTSITYDLASSANGYDLTNIVVFSGWSDKGRDGQGYQVLYATAADPNNFIVLTAVGYNPSGAQTRTANRVTMTPFTGVLAANVVRLQIIFLNAENGWSGYSEIGVYGTASSTPMDAPVYVSEDITPGTGSDVVGSSVTFKATINGSGPIAYQWRKDTGSGPVDIIGATSATLTLNNLQLSDAASPGYSLQATNEFGVVTTSAGAFTVNPVPAAVNGIIAAPANQTGLGGTVLKPTWTLAAGSLIAGSAPSTLGSGNFGQETSGGVSALTDNSAGTSGGGNLAFATCGTGSGTAVTYTLAGSASGYDLNQIVVHAGWGDSGRDGQGYRVYYSTVSDPNTFIPLCTNSYNPSIAGGIPSANRVTLRAASSDMAQNVAQVRLEFLNVENGWSGYSEIAVFGAASAPGAPTINSSADGNGNLILTGVGGTPGGSYSWLTATNVTTPLANWTTNTTGVFNVSGAFSNAIPINTTEAARYFRLKTP